MHLPRPSRRRRLSRFHQPVEPGIKLMQIDAHPSLVPSKRMELSLQFQSILHQFRIPSTPTLLFPSTFLSIPARWRVKQSWGEREDFALHCLQANAQTLQPHPHGAKRNALETIVTRRSATRATENAEEKCSESSAITLDFERGYPQKPHSRAFLRVIALSIGVVSL
jgi:hypothetical protein